MATSSATTSPRQKLLDHAVRLAIATAAKISDHPRALVVRKKSQAYLFMRLRGEFADASEEAIRETISALRWYEWPDGLEVERSERAPIKGREPVSSDCWGPRVAALAGLLVEPTTGPELVAKAQRELRWGVNFAIQVVAAAEELGALEYALPNWRRAEVEKRESPRASATVAPVVAVSKPADAPAPQASTIERQLGFWPVLAPAGPLRRAAPRKREASKVQRRRVGRRPVPVLPGQLAFRWMVPAERSGGRRKRASAPARAAGDVHTNKREASVIPGVGEILCGKDGR